MTTRKQREGSLTNFEVGIIKNLLSRSGFKNQDILGLINTVRRLEGRADTNGGRISDVKTGKPRYKGSQAAPDDKTDAFIASAKNPVGFGRIDTDPLRKDMLLSLLPKSKDSETLSITETDRIECKESFGEKHFISNCIKAIAAFANNKGGYIVFGVRNKTWEIVGIDVKAFERFDRNKLNQAFRSNLSCGIDFDTTTLDFGGKSIGIMYIHPAKMKPVMFIQQNSTAGTAEGHIYYRYHGENRLIAPAELQHILEERLRNLSETILTKHLKNILSNGVENSAVLNLSTGEIDGKAGNFLIDESLLSQISFIKEGEFVEKSGSPTLKLVGEIKSSAKIIETKTEPLTTTYPLSWQEMRDAVKKAVNNATDTQINAVIKSQKIKQNPAYSGYVFRNKKQEESYKRNKKLPTAVPSIYNQAAVDFVINNLSK
jgi:uncharacterized protein YqkB